MSFRIRDLMVLSTVAGLLITAGGLVSSRQQRPQPRRVGRGLELLQPTEQGRTSSAAADGDAIERRIEAEYREMPGLGLTVAQAARLFGLECPGAEAVLRRLCERDVLRLTTRGRFVVSDTMARDAGDRSKRASA